MRQRSFFPRVFFSRIWPSPGSPHGRAGGPRAASPGPVQPRSRRSPAYRSGGTAAGWRTAHRRRRGSARRRPETWARAAGPRWRWSRLSDASGKEESEHLVLQETQADPELQQPGRRTRRTEAGDGKALQGRGGVPTPPVPSQCSTYESGGCCPGRACPVGGWEWRLATTWRCCGSSCGPT